jgi:hypothetical protein
MGNAPLLLNAAFYRAPVLFLLELVAACGLQAECFRLGEWTSWSAALGSA